MSAWVIVTAAGGGSRLGADVPKALVRAGTSTILALALQRVLASSSVSGVVITYPPQYEEEFRAEIAASAAFTRADQSVALVPGGSSRQASVLAGLGEVARRLGGLPDPGMPLLIHDAARPLAPTELLDELIGAVQAGAPAVIPTLPVVDTVTRIDPETNLVIGTPNRAQLRTVQTPQAFAWGPLYQAHLAESARGQDEFSAATDDASLLEARGVSVLAVTGSVDAFKVTLPSDLTLLEQKLAGQ